MSPAGCVRLAAVPSGIPQLLPLRSPPPRRTAAARQLPAQLHRRAAGGIATAAAAAGEGNGTGSRTTVVATPLAGATPAAHDPAATAASGPSGVSREVAEPATAPRPAGSAFSWTRHWWPLVPVAYLLPDRPNAITLLGIPLVVWLDKTTAPATAHGSTPAGTWRVFRDRCPHRLAPLSEGRLEADGSLACSYHGWRFDGSGACRRIPQAVDAAAEAAACASRRSCATSFPVRTEAGMLWVWVDDSPGAAEEAAATPLVMTNDLRERDRRYYDYVSRTAAGEKPAGPAPPPVVWFMQDLPYSYEVLMENLTDPAHLPQSHHGVTPLLNRYKDAAMPMKRAQPTVAGTAPAPAAGTSAAPAPALPAHWASPSGPDIEYDYSWILSQDGVISVTMPHHMVYTYRSALNKIVSEIFAVPVAPGRSRYITIMASRRPMPLPPLPTLLADPRKAVLPLASRVFPEMVHHVTMNDILDGDSVFLATQDELLKEVEAQADADAAKGAGADTQGVASGGEAAAARAEGGGGGGGAGFWSRLYYLPTQADSVVLAVRRWLEERAGGGPFRSRQRWLLAGPRTSAAAAAEGLMGQPLVSTVPGEAPSPQERMRRLNRYEQHTRHCPYCRPMLEQLQRMAAVARGVQAAAVLGMCIAGGALGAAAAAAAAAASAAATAAAAPASAAAGSATVMAAVPWTAPAALLAALAAVWALAGGLGAVADSLSRVFQFQDYVHAEKN